jgi:DNA-binding XRE family transcriptional regulator
LQTPLQLSDRRYTNRVTNDATQTETGNAASVARLACITQENIMPRHSLSLCLYIAQTRVTLARRASQRRLASEIMAAPRTIAAEWSAYLATVADAYASSDNAPATLRTIGKVSQ